MTRGNWLAGLSSARGGILWMLGASLLFSTQDAIVKYLSADYSVVQLVWARFTLALAAIVLVTGPRLRGLLVTRRPGLQVLRGVLLLSMMGLFYTALGLIPLADATSILFLGPLIVAALSASLLGEHVGPRRWAAVVVGFAGALIIVRPGQGTMEAAALMPLGAAFLFGFYQIVTRLLNRWDRPLTTLTYSASCASLATSALVPFHWQANPTAAAWALMVALGVIGAVSQFSLIKAYEAAPAATVAPFFYVSLIWAVGYGYVLFGDFPDLWTATGALIITGSGLYVFHRAKVRGATDRQIDRP
ncbi:MAG: DMT family transporter [Rhodospirillales bacterium]|nr:DMT family transporter [Rhodospirillales bacterium]HJO72836.1 DMT family transporter [Rhodospirillales bacterium]